MSASPYDLPYEPSSLSTPPKLYGRDHEIEQIKQWQTTHQSGVLLLHGSPGVGKTSTADYYARQHRSSFSAIIWLNVKDEDTIKAGYVRLGKRLQRHFPDFHNTTTAWPSDTDELGKAAKKWLERPDNTKWLMVCDNFDASPATEDPADAYSHFKPDCYHGTYIIATRSTSSNIGHVVRLTKLVDPGAGIAILSERSGRPNLDKDLHALKLAEELDGLPLALVSAGSYLRNSKMSFEKYLHHYKTAWPKLHKSRIGRAYERSLDCTFQISYDLLAKQTPLAAKLLVWWAYFDARDVWFDLLRFAVTGKDKPEWVPSLIEDELSFETVMQTLCDFGFVEAWSDDPTSQGYSIHRCAHAWITTVLNDVQDPILAQLAVHCTISHIYERGDWDDNEVSRRVLQHAKHQFGFTLTNIKNGLPSLRAGKTLGTYFTSVHRLVEADTLLTATLDAAGNLIGQDHLATIYLNDQICDVYLVRGLYRKANACIARSFAWLAGPGSGNRDLLISTLDHIMRLHNYQGDASSAEQVSRFLLAYRTHAHGVDAEDVMATMDNLAEALRAQGRCDECITIRRELVELYTRSCGEHHKNTLMAMNNLAEVLWETGHIDESEKLFDEILDGRRATLGEDHPDTLCSLNSVAIMRGEKNDKKSHEALSRQAVKSLRATLGDADPLTQMCMHNLAGALFSLGKHEEAEQLIRDVLRNSIEVFGIQHVKTLTVIDNLVYLLCTLARFEEAEAECRIGFEAGQEAMKEKAFPPLADLISTTKQQADLTNKQTSAYIRRSSTQQLSSLEVIFLNLSARMMTLLCVSRDASQRNKLVEEWVARSSNKKIRRRQDLDDRVRGTGGAIPTFASPEHF